MTQFLRQISILVLFSFLAVSNLYSEDSCTSPTENIKLNIPLKDQEIDKPYIIGYSGGEAYYYKIVLSVDGRLIVNTAIDTENADNAIDTVNTHGQLLYSDCSNLDNSDIEINSNPRYFKFDKVLTAGIYYLRVHNEVAIDDSSAELAKGFFQIENSFTPSAPAKQISITKTSATSMNSGTEIIYTINVKNEGTESTTSVQVSDPIPTPNHLTYIGVDASTPGWTCISGDPVVCTLDSGEIAYKATRTLKLKYRADYQTYNRSVSNTTFVDVNYNANTLHEDALLRSVMITKETPSINLTMSTVKTGTLSNITSVVEGNAFEYRLIATNNGTLVDDNVTISDTIDNKFTITNLPAECTASGQVVTCDLSTLAVGASWEGRIEVTAVGFPAINIPNHSTITADTILGAVSKNITKDIDIVAKNAVVNITKTASASDVTVGHAAYYNINVNSIGSNISLTNINVTDTVPGQLTLTSVSGTGWDCSASDILTNKVDCTLLSLASGVTANNLRVNVEGKTAQNGVINRVDVDTTEGATNYDEETINVLAQTVGIDIQKSVSSPSVNSLETFNYILSISNSGSEDNSDIIVTDTLDPQFVLPVDWNSNVAPWSCTNSGNTITCNYTGTLTVLSPSAPDITLKVQAPYTTTNLSIDNTAVVNAKAGATLTPVTDTDMVSVNVNPVSTGFFVTKTSDKPSVKSGENFVYTIRVDNDGNLEQQNIIVTDTIAPLLDGNFTVNQGDFICSTVDRDINCTLSTLAAKGDAQFTISVTAPAVSSSTVVVNTANATSKIIIPPHINETKIGSDSATVTIHPADSSLSIVKSASQDLVLENDIFDYLISVQNNSISDEYNLTVTDNIHSDLTILSHTGSGWNCSHSGTLVTCTMATLGAGMQADDINITVQAPSTISVDRTIPNSAKVVSSKEVIGKNASKNIKLISSDNALSILMTSIPSNTYTSDPYFYRISISNNSGKDIDDINITDILPAIIQYDHYVSGGWSCNFNTTSRLFSCNNNGIKLTSSTKTIDLFVTAPNFETNVSNSISMTSSLDALTRDSNVTTEVTGKIAKLIYSKAESDKNIVNTGEDFTYTLKVKNEGIAPVSDINITNIQMTLDLDPSLSYQSYSAPGWSCSFSAPTLTCTLPLLEVGLGSSDINVVVQGLVSKTAISNTKLTADQIPLPQAVATAISVDVTDIIDLDMSLSLSDSVDPAEANSIYYYDFVIQNLDSAKTAKEVFVDLNTTSSDDYLLISYTDMADWDCAKSGVQLRCQLKHDLLPSSSETLRLEVKAPNSITKVELKAALYSIYVNDTNPSDNSVNEDTNIMKTDLTINNPREFTKVPLEEGMIDLNIFGDLITIGNQSICEKDGSGNCQEPSYFVNDYVTQEYINLDTSYGGSYKTSTSAKLEISATDEVVWAGLYWMGRIDKTISGFQTKIDNAQKVYLRADSDISGYVEVQSQRSTNAVDNSGSTIIVDKFNFMNGTDYFDYQGVADVTSYVKANGGGDYWVADIQSSEGDNLSAGWNMVVIVKDTKLLPTRALKNITVFDGFQGVWKTPDGIINTDYTSEVNQTVKGFLTPTVGPIKSSLIFFGFEGDRTLSDFIKVSDPSGVMHVLTNGKNPVDDAVNGTITRDGVTVTTRAPNLDNSSGIDVDEFYLGDINNTMGTGIIVNGQTEANISIGSLGVASNNNGGDRFFLGMFGFSTNLNDPMCYMQTLKNADFSADLGTNIQLGSMIGIEVEFHNKEIQTLTNLHGYSLIDKIFKEDQSTFELKNIGEASFTPQSTFFKYTTVDTGDANVTEVNTSIGSGATASSGGSLLTGESVFIRFNAQINEKTDDNLTNNVYSVSYDPNPNKKIMVSRCSGSDQVLHIQNNQTNGFELTHDGGIPTGYTGDISSLSYHRHLYTQVQDQSFAIDVVALDDTIEDKVGNNYRGLVKVELVNMTDFNGSKENCALLPSLGLYKHLQFDSDERQSVDLNYGDAHNNVGLRIAYLVDEYNRHVWRTETSLSLAGDNLTKVKNMLASKPHGLADPCNVECSGADEDACLGCVYRSRHVGGLANFSCSADRFVVKPKEIDMNTSSTNLIGGKDYNLTLDSHSIGYEHNITLGTNGSLEYNLTTPIDCNRGVLTHLNSTLMDGTILEFQNGEVTVGNFTYPNIGDINVSFSDTSWTTLDQNDTNATMSDCIIGSASNTPIGGKVGCNIENNETFPFAPARFVSNMITLNNFNNDTFTYMSSDANMSAPFEFSILAVLEDNTTATNFHKGCYATDINYTISLKNCNLPRYFDLNNSITDHNYSTGEFNTTEGNFTAGTANIMIGFNAKRFVSIPENPFIINTLRDINIVIDGNGPYSISGADFNDTIDKNATFYYGRANIPNVETAQDNIDVTAHYEVYCKNCNKTRYPLAKGTESGDSVFWYINNASHNTSDQGTFNTSLIDVENGITCAPNTINGLNASLGALRAPHRDRVTFKPSNWLIHNKFNDDAVSDSFNITFFSSTDSWEGRGERGMIIDQDISKRNAKKMDW